MIGGKPIVAELMSVSGGCRVRLSPLQSQEFGGARFADRLEDGTYLLDTSKVWSLSGANIAPALLADREDPDEECLDLSYSIVMD